MLKWPAVTLIVPYYRNSAMLARQVQEWEKYPETVRVVVVDDGSPEPAANVLVSTSPRLREHVKLFRIDVDIPWNRGGARNLAAKVADTEWIIHVDVDHILPAACANHLSEFSPNRDNWYRFPRFRRGAADDTRKKDGIDPAASYGPVKPHIDSYLCTRELYWRAGGYNEDFSGCLGGGSPFLSVLSEEAPVALTPNEIFLEVFTRHEVPDSSDLSLSRDTSEYKRRKAAMHGKYRGKNPIRFPWHQVAL